MLKTLKQNWIEKERLFNLSFTSQEHQLIEILQKQDYTTYSIEDKQFIRRYNKAYKEVKRAKKKFDKAQAWQRKINDAPTKLQRLKDRVANSYKLFCMDLEMCEKSKQLTEVGVSLFVDNEIHTYHFIVEETYNLRNGKQVPDHKDDFLFGKSELLPLAQIEKRIFELAQDADFYVGHAFGNDKQFLAQAGVFENRPVLDTQSYAPFYHLVNKQYNLHSVIVETLNEEPKCLHNGGNDAYWTLKSLLKMAEAV